MKSPWMEWQGREEFQEGIPATRITGAPQTAWTATGTSPLPGSGSTTHPDSLGSTT